MFKSNMQKHKKATCSLCGVTNRKIYDICILDENAEIVKWKKACDKCVHIYGKRNQLVTSGRIKLKGKS